MGLPEPPPLGSAALPPGSFDGRSVVVTGGGTGLGRAIAVEFARLGAAVAVFSRKEEHRKAGVAAVEKVGARAFECGCDIRQPDGSLEEIYQVRRQKGSSLRSFVHGVLSVATLGIWNVVGYPIEGFVSSKDFIVFRVDYDPMGTPQQVEIQGN